MCAVILLTDSQPGARQSIVGVLEENGFRTDVEAVVERAFTRVTLEQPELVILEDECNHGERLSVCRCLRRLQEGPILVLSRHAGVNDEIVALESGADDYLVNPVHERLLLARVHALTRRSVVRRMSPGHRPGPRFVVNRAAGGTLEVGPLRISSSARTVRVRGRQVGLTTAEFDLLWLLARNAGEALSRDFIRRTLQGREHDGLDRSVDLRVSRLRRKLGDRARQPALIKSVRGVGYQLAC